jgi:hypothetical protein
VQLPQARVFAEWPEAMAPEVGHAFGILGASQREAIQAWIFAQLARKNALVSAAEERIVVIDRSPLDTFAFYEPCEWQARAQALLEALAAYEPPLPVASGALLFLRGNPTEIVARMDALRGYTTETLAAQQTAFERLTDWLAERGISIASIDTAGRAPEEIVMQTATLVQKAPYQEANLQAAIETIAADKQGC